MYMRFRRILPCVAGVIIYHFYCCPLCLLCQAKGNRNNFYNLLESSTLNCLHPRATDAVQLLIPDWAGFAGRLGPAAPSRVSTQTARHSLPVLAVARTRLSRSRSTRGTLPLFTLISPLHPLSFFSYLPNVRLTSSTPGRNSWHAHLPHPPPCNHLAHNRSNGTVARQ